MGYKKEIYDKAFKFISDQKKQKEAIYDHALADLRTADSEFYSIEINLSKLGSELIPAAISGNTARINEIQKQ